MVSWFGFLLSKFKFISYLFCYSSLLSLSPLTFLLSQPPHFLFPATLCSLSLFPDIYIAQILTGEGARELISPASPGSGEPDKKGRAASAPRQTRGRVSSTIKSHPAGKAKALFLASCHRGLATRKCRVQIILNFFVDST